MRAIFTVLRKEFFENLRDRRTLLSALIFGPLFGPLLFGGVLSFSFERAANDSDKPLTIAVSHAERAPNLVAWLVGHGATIERVSYDDETARTAIREGKHRVVLAIPEDFGSRFTGAEPATLQLYVDAADMSQDRSDDRTRALIGQYAQTVARLRLVARGVDPIAMLPITLQDVDVSTPTTRSAIPLGMLSYLILLTMLMGGLYLSIDATAGERERGSLEPLLTTPVPREHLIYGKILASCAYMLVSLTLTVTAFAIVLRFVGLERWGMSANFGPLTALGILGSSAPLVLLGASLMTIVAAFTRSYREAQTWLGFVLLVPTLPLIFAGMVGLKPSLPLMAVPSLSQHFLILSLLRDEALPATYVLLSVAGTLALGLVLARIAGGLYSREKLLG